MSARLRPPPPAPRRGFTLVEILVAIVILGVVALLAYRATAAMTDGEARLAAEAERWRTLEATLARMEADLRQAMPRPSRRVQGAEAAWSLAADARGDSVLVFTRAGSEFALEPGVAGQRIGYRLRGGELEVLYWPQLDNVPAAAPVAYALARGVAAFRVRARAGGGGWSARWPLAGESAVPRAVRVEIDLPEGTVERWFVLR